MAPEGSHICFYSRDDRRSHGLSFVFLGSFFAPASGHREPIPRPAFSKPTIPGPTTVHRAVHGHGHARAR
nr:hypothetical protein [Candidatus Sigynarchaeota archaeon]